MKTIALFGSTGSVGTNVLDVVRRYPHHFRIKALSASENVNALIGQAKEFGPEAVVIGNQGLYGELKKGIPAKMQAFAGAREIENLAGGIEADIIFMAISGTAALRPLIAALEAGRTVALASKEPIVSAGMLIRRILAEDGAKIIPVDSEHSAVMQCLTGRKNADIRTLYITGSGGSLLGRRAEDFDTITVQDVLNHPKWDMGRKITVDSATLMNKGLEVIEARWLFDVPPEKIKVVIHPEAVVHALVEFLDGTISAAMFSPDMRFPILKALAFPDIMNSDFPRVDLCGISSFDFREPDTHRFPALELAYEALRSGGTVPAVLNGANESAVGLFLDGRIKFTDIIRCVRHAVDGHAKIDDPTLDEIIECQRWAHEEVLKSC